MKGGLPYDDAWDTPWTSPRFARGFTQRAEAGWTCRFTSTSMTVQTVCDGIGPFAGEWCTVHWSSQIGPPWRGNCEFQFRARLEQSCHIDPGMKPTRREN